MILLSHPTGNANVRAAAQAFEAADLLSAFYTCVRWDPNAILDTLLPDRVVNQFRRRIFSGIPLEKINQHPLREFGRLGFSALGQQRLVRYENSFFSIDQVCCSLDLHVSKSLSDYPQLRAVYSYEDSSLSTFQQAKRLGLKCLYELPIGYWRAAQAIYSDEANRLPEWACTLGGLSDSAAKLDRKDQELSYADTIFVPSNFVRSTLLEHGISDTGIYVIPYGAPPPLKHVKQITKKGPLKVLFVGSLGQRKGLADLLEAISYLGDIVSLTLIGKQTSHECGPLNKALQCHRWIETLPNSEILSMMQNHDVLVLPSLFEGFPLVMIEAQSQGLPVIATPNAAANDLLTDGVEGFIVPIRDPRAIAQRLQQLADNRDMLEQMSAKALSLASVRSWACYQQQLVATVTSLL